jgi:hypothetical protein
MENFEQMIAEGQETKRLIYLTDGNIENSHIPVKGLRSFLPNDCFGASTKRSGLAGKPIRIQLEGLDKVVETDIGSDAKTGKPRRQFRARGWVKEFFRRHNVRSGDVLELERVEGRLYRLRLASRAETGGQQPLRVAEFFAGIGLVRLARERSVFPVRSGQARRRAA